MADVTIYTTDFCAYCTRAKGLLRRKGVTFTEIDVSNDDLKRAWLLEHTFGRRVTHLDALAAAWRTV